MVLIPYEHIVDIDSNGDDSFHTPQIFAIPFDDGDLIKATNRTFMQNDGHWQSLWFDKSKYKRIKYFPARYRQKKEPPIQQNDPATGRPPETPFPDLNK
jgi:hypothetical protein